MQVETDYAKLKSSDKEFTKLYLNFTQPKIESVDWNELRTAISENTVVREVHVRISKEFCDEYPLSETIKLFQSIGALPKLKYVCLGQMTGDVTEFGQVPLQAVTALLEKGGEKVLWWLMRGIILTHVYEGSEEEKEDKGDLSLDVSAHNKTRKTAKENKKKKEKKSKKKKEKESRESLSASKTDLGGGDIASLDVKQQAAKRCLEKLGDTLVGLRGLKRVSLMGHFDETLQGCSLDPLLEGMSALGDAALEILFVAMTRHEGKVLVEPSTLGHFLDSAKQHLKECSILYMEVTDDHIDEAASAIVGSDKLAELMLSGDAPADKQVGADSIGALFRSQHLTKLSLNELTLTTPATISMCIQLAKYNNIKSLEIKCPLMGLELSALQQMIWNNTGLETFHVHVTALEAVSAPLELVSAVLASKTSQLTTLKLETKDANENAKKLKDMDPQEWNDVVDGFFKVDRKETLDSHITTLTKI